MVEAGGELRVSTVLCCALFMLFFERWRIHKTKDKDKDKEKEKGKGKKKSSG